MLRIELNVLIVLLSCTGGTCGCQINLCLILPDVCADMTCVMDANCQPACVCDDSSTDPSCLEPTADPNDVPDSSPGCSGDTACVHGTCNNTDAGEICVCEDGWAGYDCNTLCTLDCPEGHVCTIGVAGAAVCMPIVTPSVTNTTAASPPPTATTGTREKNVCNESHYELPALWEHECGLPCLHGVCRVLNGTMHACDCDPGSSGTICQHKCCLDCNGRGNCFMHSEISQPTCNCFNNFTGPDCMEIVTAPSIQVAEQSTWYLWVAGVSFAMLLVLLVLLVVLPYWMWRRRVILVMKIIHFFQNYEDDDERQWDAFVSYKSTQVDEQFVVHTLLPKLEKELGFRLHVHFRDFLPGDTIADNILRAVTGSRRTILVVSPEFARAEWTKFEYQVAQQEMLKRKHRIIPIVLEDLAESKVKLEPSLKAILESVTYLEWPKCGNEKKVEKFWKRLELSLPKKRVTSVEQGPEFDTSGYDTIRPDSVDVSFVSEKAEQGLHNGYMTRLKIQDPEEDYATLNEAEMTSDYDKITKNDEELNEKNTAMDAKYNLENKTSEKYLNILNGDISMHTIEV